jgi:hypothetical protein
MAEAGYFVRVKGKIMGPYGIEALRRYAREGRLSRIHEISADRVQWNPAGEYEDLFPAAATVAAPSALPSRSSPSPARSPSASASHVSGRTPAASAGEIALKPPAASLTAAKYYYAKEGTSYGPIAISVLRLLAEKGTLHADDLVWHEGAQTSTPAAEIPALSAIYANRPASAVEETQAEASAPYYAPTESSESSESSEPAPAYIPEYQRPATTRKASRRKMNSATMAVGLIAGGIMALCMLLPWVSVGTRTVWSWSVFDVPGGTMIGVVLIYLLLAGIAVCILAPATIGMTRGICFVSLAGGALLLMMVAPFAADSAGAVSWDWPLSLLFFPALAVLAGVCFARASAPAYPPMRLFLAIFSGIVALTLLVSFYRSYSKFHEIPPGAMDVIPGSVVFGFVLIIAGLAAALAASVLGFIGLKPEYSPLLNRLTWILSLCAIGLPFMGVFVMVLAALDAMGQGFSSRRSSVSSETFREQATAMIVVMRIVAVWFSILALAMMGMMELLLASAAKSRQAMQPVMAS